jgi:protein TonB
MPTETPPPPEPERVAETPPQIMAAEPKPSAEAPPAFVVPEPPPEPPPRPKGPTDQDIDAAKGNYGSLLSREFSRHKQYPRMAQIRGWQGTTRVELHIDPNGTVTSSSVRESSGFEVLDKQALEMVRKASPLPLPPEVLRGREFTIVVPVAFRLE